MSERIKKEIKKGLKKKDRLKRVKIKALIGSVKIAKQIALLGTIKKKERAKVKKGAEIIIRQARKELKKK